MPLFRTCPFEEIIVRATDEKNVNDDWALIMEIVDKAANYDEGPKLILHAITKRLYHNVPRVAVQALRILDACVKNCGRRFHLEVASRHFVAEIPKILQKMNFKNVSDKFKTLIKQWAEVDFKDDPELGLIPSLYYKLKSEGVQFPEEEIQSKPAPPPCTNPDAVSSQEEEEDIVKAITLSLKETKGTSTNGNLYSFKEVSEPICVELIKVRALYDFDAVEDNELTIRAGEIIVVLDKSNESWWKGSNQRGEGFFPVSFVTEDLDAPIEIFKVPENSSEIEEDKINEKILIIDEKKIHLALQLLSDIDPSEDYQDEKSLLDLEHECYSMSPLIEEKLQEIDKKCTVLNALNDEIVQAIQSFYKLTRDSLIPAQFGYYYNVSPEAMLAGQPTQEVGVSHAGSAVVSQSMQKPVMPSIMPSNFYIPPNFLPNLVPLAHNQIRPNMVNLPFIHPQYFPPHMLSQKLNTGVGYVVPGPSLPNSEYMATIPPNQSITKMNVEDGKNTLPNYKEQNTLGNLNQLTLLDTENFSVIPQPESSLPLNHNDVPSTSHSISNSTAVPTGGQPSELSSVPVQNYVTPAANTPSATAAVEYNQNTSTNGHIMQINNYPSSLVASDNVPISNERLTENGIINQNGQ